MPTLQWNVAVAPLTEAQRTSLGRKLHDYGRVIEDEGFKCISSQEKRNNTKTTLSLLPRPAFEHQVSCVQMGGLHFMFMENQIAVRRVVSRTATLAL